MEYDHPECEGCEHQIDGECQLIGWPDDGSCAVQESSELTTEGEVLMTAQEKWGRMENPKCLADYGLSMSLKEIQSIPAGQAWLKRWVPQQAPTELGKGEKE